MDHQDVDGNVDFGGFLDESFIWKGKAPSYALDAQIVGKILRTVDIVDADRVLEIVGTLEVVRLFKSSPDWP